jgi:hypothetical protein
MLESLQGLGFAFSGDFDSAVTQVTHPAVQAFATRGGMGEKAEPDVLHSPGEDVPTCVTHAEAGRLYIVRQGGQIPARLCKNSLAFRAGSLYLRGLTEWSLVDSDVGRGRTKF